MIAVLDAPPPKRFTPEDLLELPNRGKGYELVDGELREQNISFLSTFVAGRAFLKLGNFVEDRGLGWVSPEGTSYRCFPDDPARVRRADTAFHKLSRMTVERAREEGHCTIVPDLVVEVVSPNDSSGDVNEKRIEWLEAGAQLVWVIYPVQQTVQVFRGDSSVSDFRRTDMLTAEPVLPDFRIPVADLFRLPASV